MNTYNEIESNDQTCLKDNFVAVFPEKRYRDFLSFWEKIILVKNLCIF